MSPPMRVLLVDDEPLARRGLRLRLQAMAGVEVVGEAPNGRLALAAIRELRPDVVFLDIEMPGLSGFDVIGRLPGDSLPAIVFVTAYDRYAVQAFEARALDYLLKPVDEDRLAATIEHLRLALRDRQAARQHDRLLQVMADLRGAGELSDLDLEDLLPNAVPAPPHVLVIRQGRELVRLPVADIDWIDAAGDYMCVHARGETHILRGTMKSLEERLDPARFQRVHRSTIVNVARVRRLRAHMNGEYFLDLEDGHELKLSRSYRDSLDRLLSAGAD